MTEEKEVGDMPLWQDHERRITTLENTFSGITHEMKEFRTESKEMQSEMRQMRATFEKSNGEQKDLLNTLIDHHLETNKMKLSNFWKVILNITGAGGLLMAVIYALVQFLGG